jgi:hypothetical protein
LNNNLKNKATKKPAPDQSGQGIAAKPITCREEIQQCAEKK